MNVKSIWLPAWLIFAAPPGHAAGDAGQGDSAHERRLASCIAQSAGGRPWLEKTLWGLRDQEAGRVGVQVRNPNGSYDLGPLQVNSWWVPKIAKLTGQAEGDIRWWLVHNPCFNVEAARWIFLAGLASTGDYWQAIGTYHSSSPLRQKRYAIKVAQRMKRRFGSDLFEASAETPRTVADPAAEITR